MTSRPDVTAAPALTVLPHVAAATTVATTLSPDPWMEALEGKGGVVLVVDNVTPDEASGLTLEPHATAATDPARTSASVVFMVDSVLV